MGNQESLLGGIVCVAIAQAKTTEKAPHIDEVRFGERC
jgi:hypothetical protein